MLASTEKRNFAADFYILWIMAKCFGKLLTATALMAAVATQTDAQTPQLWRDSLATINRRIELTPSSIDLRLKKAALNIELNQWDYAVEEYGWVLQRDPKNLSALYFRAYANNHLQRFDLARSDYESFLALMPRHFEAQLGLAMVKRRLGRTSEVADELNQLVQMFPDSAMAYAARADFEVEQNQWELSLYDWDEAIRLAPDNTELVASKVNALLLLKRKKEARELLNALSAKGVPRAALREWLERCR